MSRPEKSLWQAQHHQTPKVYLHARLHIQFLARKKPPSGAPGRYMGQQPPLTPQVPRGTITPASRVWQMGGLPDGPLYLGLGSQDNFEVKLNFCTAVSLTAGTLEWGAHCSLIGPRKSHGHTVTTISNLLSQQY